ncbi:hypothetical protein KY290_004686 [Solanum tuberosum]|uniref:Uncharacterized protein n=1 Tax=Solanum tuberosum TaxID=4113 RepID=A0ABQ7WDU1_SOLTU|nr:hypothetical protein KY285_004614 [Solanum tuberosum]KAH0778259.1 hypothetical protein KY290_004686 [Solanum tuberosum]
MSVLMDKIPFCSQTAIIADTSQFMCKTPVGARGSSDQSTLRPAVQTQSEVEMIEPVHIFLNQFMKLHSATYKHQTEVV